MSFIIFNKAKGWWVVQRDPNGTGDIVTDSSKSGWRVNRSDRLRYFQEAT
jgi:hypothetical protein